MILASASPLGLSLAVGAALAYSVSAIGATRLGKQAAKTAVVLAWLAHGLLLAMGLTGIAYVAFMFLVDVPMYWSRWVADEAVGRHYLSLSQGVLDTSGRWVVSQQWQVWKSEVIWMTLYFSVAVWLSIAFVHLPVLKRLKNGDVILVS